MKTFLLTSIFFSSATVLVIVSGFIISLSTAPHYDLAEPVEATSPVLGTFNANIVAKDARAKLVEQFLREYSCPMEPYDFYANEYVTIADKYNLDFRLLPSISMQESNCCKKIPEGSNNCWGYGIYGDQVTRFESYEAGIEQVAATLAKRYSTQGLLDADEIMTRYTPSSNGSWAAGVLHFMNVMK